jgi:uncharacterized membrane protein/mono/diheme cytochrome c family protein
MQKFYRVLSYFIFALNGLLIFFWFFHEKLIIPKALQVFGRMHPMLLHLPIGFFVLVIVLLLFKNQFKRKSFQKTYQLILAFTAISLVVTALMGTALSREGGYDGSVLNRHFIFGVLVSVLAAVLVGIPLTKKLSTVVYMLTATGFILIVLTGHFGAALTHGENYLLAPLQLEKKPQANKDSLTIFTAAISPVLEKKCTSCHNPNKKKGELILTDQENILKGGESGGVLIAGKPNESEMTKRLHLDIAHDDHMPPSGKPQLSHNEIRLLEKWILEGANFKTYWNSVATTDSIKLLGEAVLATYQKPKETQYEFDYASTDKVKKLNNPFRSVSQLSASTPALKANYSLAQYFKPESLQDLSEIKLQLTELNLSGMPIGDNDVDQIAVFKNLELLNLNNTQLTDEGLKKLTPLSRLRKLSVAGTKVTASGLENLSQIKTLEEVYVWNTSAKATDVEKLKIKLPSIAWNVGFVPNENEKLKLTPPILKNESFILGEDEKIIYKHNLPGTQIRYTIDGTSPDSVNGTIYTQPITLTAHTTVKTIATKNEWRKSNETEHRFFKKGISQVQAKLITIPHKDYKSNGASILTDGQTGDPNSFREGTWLGYRENKFEASFQLPTTTQLKEVTILYNENIGSYIMPPKEVEIWGGENINDLKQLKKINPEQPAKYEPNKVGVINTTVDCTCQIIKIIAAPVANLPSWHSGKGEKGWVMVSEVILR